MKNLFVAGLVLLIAAGVFASSYHNKSSGEQARVPNRQTQYERTRVLPPLPISVVQPEYTDEAKNARIEGVVLVSLTVPVTGIPTDLVVSKGLGHGLDERAVEAVSHWRFQPASRCLHAVPAHITVPVHFRVNDSSSSLKAFAPIDITTAQQKSIRVTERTSASMALVFSAVTESCAGRADIFRQSLVCRLNQIQGGSGAVPVAGFAISQEGSAVAVTISLRMCGLRDGRCVDSAVRPENAVLLTLADSFRHHLDENMRMYGCLP